MLDHARTLLAQHARTTQLLGVDFLPLGRAPEPGPDREPAPQPEPERAEAYVEAKPDNAVSVVSEPDVRDEVRRGRQESAAGRAEGAQPIAIEELRAAYEQLSDPAARLDALRAKYEQEQPHRHFNTDFKNIVFGEGDANADLMFIGEAPGEQEDLSGRPFVGRAGQLLEKMIVAMGFGRESVYICNVLKTRPPGNATPTMSEAALCAPYLLEQIRIVSPRVIVTLGLPATHLVLGTTGPMRSLRGRWQAFPPKSGVMSGINAGEYPRVEVMPTYHPSYLLRSYTEENRRTVWSDLKQVIERLGEDT